MILRALPTLALALTLTGLSSGAQKDRSFKKQVRAANRAVVSIVDTRSGDVLTHGTTVAGGTVVTKASEIGDIPQEHLRVRHSGTLEISSSWIDEKNDLAVLTVGGGLPRPVEFSATGDLGQGRILTAVTGGKASPMPGTVSVPAREIEMRNGVLGVGLQIFRRRENHPVIITEIFPGGGAEAAGLQPGDTILSINDKGLGNSRQLIDTVFSYLPGEIVKLRILREDKEFDQDVKLAHMTVLDPVDFIRARNILISGAISKRVSGFTHAIQHDIALSPQQMGTPVLDTSGKIVALNIARADRLTTYALPAAIVRTAIDNAAGSRNPTSGSESPPQQEDEPETPPESETAPESEGEPEPEPDSGAEPATEPGGDAN